MTKVEIPERATRPYTPPRLIRPEAERLSPEGKTNPGPNETNSNFLGPS